VLVGTEVNKAIREGARQLARQASRPRRGGTARCFLYKRQTSASYTKPPRLTRTTSRWRQAKAALPPPRGKSGKLIGKTVRARGMTLRPHPSLFQRTGRVQGCPCSLAKGKKGVRTSAKTIQAPRGAESRDALAAVKFSKIKPVFVVQYAAMFTEKVHVAGSRGRSTDRFGPKFSRRSNGVCDRPSASSWGPENSTSLESEGWPRMLGVRPRDLPSPPVPTRCCWRSLALERSSQATRSSTRTRPLLVFFREPAGRRRPVWARGPVLVDIDGGDVQPSTPRKPSPAIHAANESDSFPVSSSVSGSRRRRHGSADRRAASRRREFPGIPNRRRRGAGHRRPTYKFPADRASPRRVSGCFSFFPSKNPRADVRRRGSAPSVDGTMGWPRAAPRLLRTARDGAARYYHPPRRAANFSAPWNAPAGPAILRVKGRRHLDGWTEGTPRQCRALSVPLSGTGRPFLDRVTLAAGAGRLPPHLQTSSSSASPDRGRPQWSHLDDRRHRDGESTIPSRFSTCSRASRTFGYRRGDFPKCRGEPRPKASPLPILPAS